MIYLDDVNCFYGFLKIFYKSDYENVGVIWKMGKLRFKEVQMIDFVFLFYELFNYENQGKVFFILFRLYLFLICLICIISYIIFEFLK